MKYLVLAGAILFSATAALSAETTVTPDRIVDAAIGDWNKDGQPDLALLTTVPPSDDSDIEISIYIYLRDKERSLLRLVAAAPGKVWGRAEPGGIMGQEPSITALPNGSIAVTSQNDAIGRDRWHQTLTIALRNNAFIVAGFTFDYRDNLEAGRSYSCDYNVLTGKATKRDKEFKAEARTIRIEDWDDEIGRKICDEAP